MWLRSASRRISVWFALGLLWSVSATAVAAGSASPAAATGPNWTYGVRPGDDLWRLAARYCGSTSFAMRLAKHNGLSSPRALQAGTRLNIPVAWLVRQPADVTVQSVSGEVQLSDGQALAAGDRIEMGQTVVTGEGFAVMLFADGSQLEIGQQSQVLFNILTAYGDTGMVDTHLRFYRGRGAAKVIKRETPSQFRIWTPTGIAAVRGTDFRVGSTGAGSEAKSRIETVTGAVDFEQSAQTTNLPAGFGAVASQAGTSKEQLLQAPVVENTGRSLWQPDQSVQWQPVADAGGYQTKVYRIESGSLRPLRSGSQSGTSYELANLDAGAYAFAVRAVAASGLEGFDTQFELRMGALAPQVAGGTAESYVVDDSLRWRSDASGPGVTGDFEVQMATDDDFADPRSYASTQTSLALADTMARQPGQYFWRVRQPDSAYSKTQRIEVRPAVVQGLQVEPGGADLAPLTVRWVSRPGETYDVLVRRGRGSKEVFAQSAVAAGELQVPAPGPGDYAVAVVARGGGIASDPVSVPFTIEAAKQPWWPPGLLLLPVLFLL